MSHSNKDGLKIAFDRIAAEKVARTGTLDLGQLGLREIPDDLLGLTHLERLNLGHRYQNHTSLFMNSKSCIEENTIAKHIYKLKWLPNLKHLFLSFIKLGSLDFLEDLNGLVSLDCSYCNIKDLSPITKHLDLQMLVCSGFQITDLSPISQLPKLNYIDLRATCISDLSPLSNLKQLHHIYCSSTLVKDLLPLIDLFDLKSLDCQHTNIRDLAPLRKMRSLQRLHCFNTSIDNIPDWLIDCTLPTPTGVRA